MGCFDFTYADNGRNIRGQRGYVYLTDSFCEETGMKSPIRFISTDEYGRFNVVISASQTIELDIFALYAAMVYLEKQIPYCNESEKDALEVYLYFLSDMWRRPTVINPSLLEELENCEQVIRRLGIGYWFGHIKPFPFNPEIEKNASRWLCVPALGSQHEKTITAELHFTGQIPLVITRKKLPINPSDSSFETTIKNWGFVSSDDPNQGWFPTKDLYLPWFPDGK